MVSCDPAKADGHSPMGTLVKMLFYLFLIVAGIAFGKFIINGNLTSFITVASNNLSSGPKPSDNIDTTAEQATPDSTNKLALLEKNKNDPKGSDSKTSSTKEALLEVAPSDNQPVGAKDNSAFELLSAKKTIENLSNQTLALQKTISDLQNRLGILNTELVKARANPELSKRTEEKIECENKLNMANSELSRIPILEQRIVQLNNELALMQTEVALVRGKKYAFRTRNTNITDKSPNSSVAPAIPPSNRVPPPTLSTSDVDTAVVKVDKVNLRSGPGMESAVVMEVSKGNTFVIEKREGEWYRVVTPVGTRAYLRADTIDVISAGSNLTNQTSTTSPTDGLINKKSVADIAREARVELQGNQTTPSPSQDRASDLEEFDKAYKALKEQIGKK